MQTVSTTFNWFKSIPGSNEAKLSVLSTFFEKYKQQMADEVKKEEERREAIIMKISEEHKEIAALWGDLETWGEICEIFEDPSYDIARILVSNKINPQFFHDLCERWIGILDGHKGIDPTRIGKITALGGFRYSLACMLIYARTLFNKNWEPLKRLWIAAGYGEDDCNFENLEAMKNKGMEIMRSASNYDLAYM
jgi:hypothetical protein